MKKLLLILLLFPVLSKAQRPTITVNWDSLDFKLTEIISGLKFNKAQLYSIIMDWENKPHPPTIFSLQTKSPLDGLIILNGSMKFINDKFVFGRGLVDYITTIDIRDNKCRIVMSDFSHKATISGGLLSSPKAADPHIRGKRWETLKNYVYNNSADLMNEFADYLKGVTTPPKIKDDW